MKTLLTLITIASLTSCSSITAVIPKAKLTWIKENPLNEPGHTEPTQAELHLKNIRIITNNPAKQ